MLSAAVVIGTLRVKYTSYIGKNPIYWSDGNICLLKKNPFTIFSKFKHWTLFFFPVIIQLDFGQCRMNNLTLSKLFNGKILYKTMEFTNGDSHFKPLSVNELGSCPLLQAY